MNAEAEILVVGGGIAGVSLAWSLAQAGVVGVAVVEGHVLGSGATGASAGGVRQQFSTPLEIELSKRALRFWRDAEGRLDAPCEFVQQGYLFVTARPEVLEALKAAALLQLELGAGPVHILDPDEVSRLAPWLLTADLAGGSYTPLDGRVNPTDGLAAIAGAARRLGVTVREHWPVTGLQRQRRGWVAQSPRGNILARTLVVAAGVGTTALVRPLGCELEIRPWRIHYGITGPALRDVAVPSTMDLDTGMTVKREGHGLSVGVLRHDLPLGSDPWQALEEFAEVASRRAPALAEVGVARTMSGLADLTADGHAFVGEVEEGCWVIAGFCGHGTMHGPVVADLLERTMLGDPDPTIDLAGLSPHRTRPAAAEWLVAGRK